MDDLLLECLVCGESLSIVFYEDGRKCLGCLKCSLTPLVTHSDMNKVLDKWCEVVKCNVVT